MADENVLTPTFTHSQFGEDFVLYAEFGFYGNGRLAIQLFDRAEGQFATITVNMPDLPEPEHGTAYIKGYAENYEVFRRLMEVGWLRSTGQIFPTGFATVELMELSGPLLDYMNFWLKITGHA